MSDNRTDMSSFRTFGSILKIEEIATERSDFGRLLYFYIERRKGERKNRKL